MEKYHLIHKVIGKKNVARLNQVLRIERKNIFESIPHKDLSEKHLKNLKVVTNREKMLDLIPKNGVIAEIGVAFGDFSLEIIKRVQPAKFHLIDFWESDGYSAGYEVVKEKFKQELDSGKVQINFGLSVEALGEFENNYFDWVYIDTDHSYLTTKAELEVCLKKVKKGGIISGHDYVNGNWIGGIKYGVIEAVHEFCIQYNWELIFLTHEAHGHLSFSIREMDNQL